MKRAHSYSSATSSRRSLLNGVVICCTGLHREEKEKCHSLVERYGGHYNRDFISIEITHLIANVVNLESEKYRQACKCPNVSIVTPNWIYQSISQSKQLPIDKFVPPSSTNNNTTVVIMEEEQNKEDDFWKQSPFLHNNNNIKSCNVFMNCRIYLVGFLPEEQQQIAQYIRVGRGLHIWDVELSMTHIIVHSQCSSDLRRAIGVVCQHHPNQPMMAIRPQWIIECLRQQKLLNPSLYPPIIITQKPPPSQKKNKKTKMVSNIFQGAVFLWSIQTNSSSSSMLFDSNKIEQCILENGGHMASEPHVRQVLQKSSSRRVCFVIRSISTDTIIKEEQMVGQWCDMVSVTPLWIMSCVQQKSDISPTKFFPTWFQPQPWPFQKIITISTAEVITIAVTGFVGMERTAIKVLVTAMGATYTDTLTPSNTHLIVNNNNNNGSLGGGAKYRKALEWNIHIITIEWLHHILRYGFYGKHPSNENQQGCEHFFSPTTQNETTDTNTISDTATDPPQTTTTEIIEQTHSIDIKHKKASEDRLRKTLQSLETPLSNKSKNMNRRVRRSPRRQIQLKGQEVVEDDGNDDEDNHLNFSIEPSRQTKRDLNTDSMIESQAIWYGNQTQYP